MSKWHAEKLLVTSNESKCVPIISNAMIIAEPIGDGRGIPLIIIDCSDRQDIANLFENHKLVGNGEVKTRWMRTSSNKNMIGIFIEFTKPINCKFFVEFDITKSGNLVDLITKSQALYVQPGQNGDKISNTLDNERIILEIQSEEFRDEWEKIYRTQMTKHFKREYKVSQRKAISLAEKFIDELRQIGDFRIK